MRSEPLVMAFPARLVIEYPFALPAPMRIDGIEAIRACFAAAATWPLKLQTRHMVVRERVNPQIVVVEGTTTGWSPRPAAPSACRTSRCPRSATARSWPHAITATISVGCRDGSAARPVHGYDQQAGRRLTAASARENSGKTACACKLQPAPPLAPVQAASAASCRRAGLVPAAGGRIQEHSRSARPAACPGTAPGLAVPPHPVCRWLRLTTTSAAAGVPARWDHPSGSRIWLPSGFQPLVAKVVGPGLVDGAVGVAAGAHSSSRSRDHGPRVTPCSLDTKSVIWRASLICGESPVPPLSSCGLPSRMTSARSCAADQPNEVLDVGRPGPGTGQISTPAGAVTSNHSAATPDAMNTAPEVARLRRHGFRSLRRLE